MIQHTSNQRTHCTIILHLQFWNGFNVNDHEISRRQHDRNETFHSSHESNYDESVSKTNTTTDKNLTHVLVECHFQTFYLRHDEIIALSKMLELNLKS